MNHGRYALRSLLASIGILFCIASPAISSALAGPSAPTIPDVDFVLLRLDRVTYEVQHAYRFTQPFRKIVQPEGTSAVADLFVDHVEPVDYGYTDLTSRLTGQMVFRGTTVYTGNGDLEWPTPVQVVPFSRGAQAPDTSLFGWFRFYTSMNQSEAHLVWDSVRDVDLVAAIASSGPYGVVVFDHVFDYGLEPPELDVLVYSRPPAPPDAGVLRLDWPRSVVTARVRTVPEARVHNFGDTTASFDVDARLLADGVVVHESRRGVTDLPADASMSLSFDPFFPRGTEPLTFEVRLRRSGGGDWIDAFADDDSISETTDVVSLPVFRPISSMRHPGPVPTGGEVLDFDGDGDPDIVRNSDPGRGYTTVFLRNDGAGGFTDITAAVQGNLKPYSRRALAGDFTGDGVQDVLLVYFAGYPILLRGDGAGGFEETTQASGLSAYTETVGLQAFDFEGDGDRDLLLVQDGSAGAVVLLNDGYGHFIDGTGGSGLDDISSQTQWITVGDVDGDGLPDLLVAAWNGVSTVYRNEGGARTSGWMCWERASTRG